MKIMLMDRRTSQVAITSPLSLCSVWIQIKMSGHFAPTFSTLHVLFRPGIKESEAQPSLCAILFDQICVLQNSLLDFFTVLVDIELSLRFFIPPAGGPMLWTERSQCGRICSGRSVGRWCDPQCRPLLLLIRCSLSAFCGNHVVHAVFCVKSGKGIFHVTNHGIVCARVSVPWCDYASQRVSKSPTWEIASAHGDFPPPNFRWNFKCSPSIPHL